jgi:hypothetical protein
MIKISIFKDIIFVGISALLSLAGYQKLSALEKKYDSMLQASEEKYCVLLSKNEELMQRLNDVLLDNANLKTIIANRYPSSKVVINESNFSVVSPTATSSLNVITECAGYIVWNYGLYILIAIFVIWFYFTWFVPLHSYLTLNTYIELMDALGKSYSDAMKRNSDTIFGSFDISKMFGFDLKKIFFVQDGLEVKGVDQFGTSFKLITKVHNAAGDCSFEFFIMRKDDTDFIQIVDVGAMLTALERQTREFFSKTAVDSRAEALSTAFQAKGDYTESLPAVVEDLLSAADMHAMYDAASVAATAAGNTGWFF